MAVIQNSLIISSTACRALFAEPPVLADVRRHAVTPGTYGISVARDTIHRDHGTVTVVSCEKLSQAALVAREPEHGLSAEKLQLLTKGKDAHLLTFAEPRLFQSPVPVTVARGPSSVRKHDAVEGAALAAAAFAVPGVEMETALAVVVALNEAKAAVSRGEGAPASAKAPRKRAAPKATAVSEAVAGDAKPKRSRKVKAAALTTEADAGEGGDAKPARKSRGKKVAGEVTEATDAPGDVVAVPQAKAKAKGKAKAAAASLPAVEGQPEVAEKTPKKRAAAKAKTAAAPPADAIVLVGDVLHTADASEPAPKKPRQSRQVGSAQASSPEALDAQLPELSSGALLLLASSALESASV